MNKITSDNHITNLLTTKQCCRAFRKIACFVLISIFSLNCAFSQVLSSTKDVYPVNDKSKIKLLNGSWKFQYINSSSLGIYSSFNTTGYDASSWSSIPVPGNWEYNGFKTPEYAYVSNVTGLYLTTFSVPSAWTSQHIFIRFEGVEFGYEFWVNGTSVGKWESSYNPCQFDITPYINGSSQNTLAVREYTQPKGYAFDTNDDWALTGIDRDVKIFPVPDAHLNDMTITSTLVDNNNAKINLKYQTSSFSTAPLKGLTIKGKIIDPKGNPVNNYSFTIKSNAANWDTIHSVSVTSPKRWTAETPFLYNADIYLCNGNDTLQHFIQKIGIRNITIAGKILSINGSTVKLRGVTMHETHPIKGRVLTKSMHLADLKLMKKANINTVRTSHYPPNSEFLELCDSIGMYVICEVPFGFGDSWLTDVSYLDILKTRALATVTRDKNHASVMIWSIGNENPFTPICDSTGRYVKRLDPSRPYCYPQYGGSSESALPSDVGIFSTHYEGANSLLQKVQNSQRPYIATEYAHELGLASEGHKILWDIIENNPGGAGGCVWEWVDQGVLRNGVFPGIDGKTTALWPTETSYYDMNGNQGADGILYPDRTPQPDYWIVRKNYSQVVIPENNIGVIQGSQNISFTLKNKYDFVNLKNKINCSWFLTQDKDTIQNGNFVPDCEPHSQITQSISINLPNSPSVRVYLMHFNFNDSTGTTLYDRVVKLSPLNGNINLLTRLDDVKLVSTPPILKSTDITKAIINTDEFGLINSTGMVYLGNTSKKSIIDGPFMRVGRKTTMAEDLTMAGKNIPKYLLGSPTVTRIANDTMITSNYLYTSTDFKVQGDISYKPSINGWIEVNFSLAPTTNTSKILLDAGMSFLLNPDITEFRWLGYGPYQSYPGKSELNEFGTYHLTSKDIDLPGNHKGVNVALLTDSIGNGFAVMCDSSNIDIDKTTSGFLLSYNTLVSGKGTKFSVTSFPVNATTQAKIQGKFKIIPLKTGNWPHLITELFGDSKQKVAPNRPFVARYDYFTSKLSDYLQTPGQCDTIATASTYQVPNAPVNVLDNDLNTRWSAQGDGAWLQLSCCSSSVVNAVLLAFQNGNSRIYTFDVQLSNDGLTWYQALTGVKSSGSTLQLQTFTFAPTVAKYVKIIGHGSNSNDWNNITECKVTGTPIIYVSGIAVSGQGNATTISTNGGTLQISAVVTPSNATPL